MTKGYPITSESLLDLASNAVVDACLEWPFARKPNGYGYVRRNGKKVGAHRVMWETVNGRDIPDGLFVLHSCDNPPCVNPHHLRVGTVADNWRDAEERGRAFVLPAQQRGEKNPRAKLTADQVREIRASSLTHRELAAAYGVSHSMISMIRTGRYWTHV